MTLDIVFDIQGRLLGVPQTPDRALCVRSNTPDGVAFVAPIGRSFLHIRAGSPSAFHAFQECIGDGVVSQREISQVMGSITMISRPIFRA